MDIKERPSRVGRAVGHDPQKLGEWLLTAYLGTAPVYWLPGLPIGSMQVIKLALIAGACGVIWYEAVQRGHRLFPPGLAGLTGFYLVLLTSFTGVMRSVSIGEAISVLENLGQSFLFLWTLYIFYTRGGNVVRVFRRAAVMIVLLSIPPITNWFTGIPGWSHGESPLWSTGFTDKRSGWTQGLAFYLPVVVAIPFFGSKRKTTTYLLTLTGMAILLIGQFVTGGRSGLLSSFVVLALVSILLLPRTISFALFAVLLGTGFYFADLAYDHLRFDHLTSWSYESVNRFSSYRLEDYVAAYELFWSKPLGHGFGGSEQIVMQEFQQSTELHNVWIRLLADGGIFLLLSSISVTTYLFVKALRGIRPRLLKRIREGLPVQDSTKRKQLLLVVCSSVLLAGVTISMVTPRTPIGVFQISAMWWGSAGVIVGITTLNRARPQ